MTSRGDAFCFSKVYSFSNTCFKFNAQTRVDRFEASENGVDGVDDAVGGDDVDVDDVGIDRRCGDLQNWALENLRGKWL